MSALNIRSWADLRAFLYTLLPVLAGFLVTSGVLDEREAAMWSALVLALLGPGLAAIYTRNVSSFRTAFYALLGAGQALLITYGIASDEQVSLWLPLVSVVIGGVAGGTAGANTGTSSQFDVNANNGVADPTAPEA